MKPVYLIKGKTSLLLFNTHADYDVGDTLRHKSVSEKLRVVCVEDDAFYVRPDADMNGYTGCEGCARSHDCTECRRYYQGVRYTMSNLRRPDWYVPES